MSHDHASLTNMRFFKIVRFSFLAFYFIFAFSGFAKAGEFYLSQEWMESLKLEESDFLPFDENQAKLGQLLFYDPILSGNRNISCGTCHHHDLHSADGLSLGLGQGGIGIGENRTVPADNQTIRRRMPRNSQALFNVGAREISQIFNDGRVSSDDYFGNGFNTPAEEFLPEGLETLLAAQSLFPLIGEVEMMGNLEENEISPAVNERIDYGWPLLIDRIRDIPDYESLFIEAFGDVDSFKDINITHVGNALGAFMGSEWRSFDSPFDQYLNGDLDALNAEELAGLEIFFGKGNCSSCHSGKLFADQRFHALAIPPFGPGRTRKFDLHVRDVGRLAESDRWEDSYRFRTPALRNVSLTAPYGHNGAYATLEGIIRHHLNPVVSLANWDSSQVILPAFEKAERRDFIIHDDRLEMERFKNFIDIEPLELSEQEIQQLIAFLHALTGTESIKGRLGRPNEVPSGLLVD